VGAVSDDPGYVEYGPTELTGLGRVIGGLVGRKRLIRWLEKPDPPRCEWTALGQRCIWDAGHRGTCRTQEQKLNVQTGRTFIRTHDYLGINYADAPPT